MSKSSGSTYLPLQDPRKAAKRLQEAAKKKPRAPRSQASSTNQGPNSIDQSLDSIISQSQTFLANHTIDSNSES